MARFSKGRSLILREEEVYKLLYFQQTVKILSNWLSNYDVCDIFMTCRCIKFISTYGLLQPGLYRRNGPSVEVRLLLAEFRKGKHKISESFVF